MYRDDREKSPRGQKWRSAPGGPERRTRAQSATHEPRHALAREHAAHDPARITAHESPDAQHSTAPYTQHLAQQHIQSMHSHTHYLPSGGDTQQCWRDQKDSKSCIRSHRQNNVAHEQQKGSKHNKLATVLF